MTKGDRHGADAVAPERRAERKNSNAGDGEERRDVVLTVPPRDEDPRSLVPLVQSVAIVVGWIGFADGRRGRSALAIDCSSLSLPCPGGLWDCSRRARPRRRP